MCVSAETAAIPRRRRTRAAILPTLPLILSPARVHKRRQRRRASRQAMAGGTRSGGTVAGGSMEESAHPPQALPLPPSPAAARIKPGVRGSH